MKILVTGADGFIGSHLVEALVRLGYKVRAFVFYNSFGSWGWLDECDEDIKGNFEVFSGDIRDSNCVADAMHGCDVVFHLAALIAIPYSYYSPDSYLDTNIKGTLNVLQAAKKIGLKKVIHTSTSEVYGTANYVPIDENHPLRAQSPYSATKIAADQLALSFYLSFNVPVSIVRPFNTYGPRQSARAVIPSIITQLAKNKGEVCLGAISPTRDFNYIKDTVSGFIAAMNSENSIGEIVNIGSNYEVSIEKTAEIIADIMQLKLKIISSDERKRPMSSEVERLWADNAKAKTLFGWNPLYAHEEGFKKGLSETINWFTNNDNLRLYKPEIYNI
jgi:dTDP-glucose 4,6-dehydratase